MSHDPVTPSSELVAGLMRPEAYPDPCPAPIELRETHISWIFLTREFAYKVKKPIKTSFLDYSTLERRRWFCHEEVRLDRRFAPDLYLGVAPIFRRDGGLCFIGPPTDARPDGFSPSTERRELEYRQPAHSSQQNGSIDAISRDHASIIENSTGDGTNCPSTETLHPIEFAVKMRRFADDALLSHQLNAGKIATEHVHQLAERIANFHETAARADHDSPFGSPEQVWREMSENFAELSRLSEPDSLCSSVDSLKRWSSEFLDQNKHRFSERHESGFIRECHGDLHLSNIIFWNDQWVPFDGIEFNDAFRWIDVLSDACFLAMDFAASGHAVFCRCLINAYLEQTGDYGAIALLRWYLVYRALVRAKVAVIRMRQQVEPERKKTLEECGSYVALATQFTKLIKPTLWITYGLSGSGKTTGSETIVQRTGAIRLRSDVERKRLFGLAPLERPDSDLSARMYHPSATSATYDRLAELAAEILESGYNVIIDATCLKRDQRARFRMLAEEMGADFAILPFEVAPEVLRQRIANRTAQANDASDADLAVLEHQLATVEPLDDDERAVCRAYPADVLPIRGL